MGINSIRQALPTDCDFPRSEKPGRTLITDGPWDSYHLESLLPLKETYRENTTFGFLLRHYWIPATTLHLRQSSRLSAPDGGIDCAELEIERTMARCRSNQCAWREKTCPAGEANGNGAHSGTTETLCCYDCYEQTYVSAKPVAFAPPTAGEKTEARRQALYRLPMLCPTWPIPIGFSWHGKVGDDYMNYRLEADEHVGETSVLIVRREGRYTQSAPHEPTGPNGETKMAAVVSQRQGVTLFAWNRGAVLEDRFMDCVVEASRFVALRVGTTRQVVTRLVRSRPAGGPALCSRLPCPASKGSS